jgi:TRAP-type C4-dicarboxylate transport system substrate-binding protein
MRKRRVWLWQGDPMGEAFFVATGVPPVPLPLTEVFTSLSTGLLDTVIAPPLGAIALQWFTKTSYMTGMPVMDGIGGLLVSRKFFDALPRDLQELLHRTGEETSVRMLAETRRDNEKSLKVLMQHGVTFTHEWRVKESELFALRERMAATLGKSGYIPADFYARATEALNAHRARKAGQ